jgi:hypothetical protein
MKAHSGWSKLLFLLYEAQFILRTKALALYLAKGGGEGLISALYLPSFLDLTKFFLFCVAACDDTCCSLTENSHAPIAFVQSLGEAGVAPDVIGLWVGQLFHHGNIG